MQNAARFGSPLGDAVQGPLGGHSGAAGKALRAHFHLADDLVPESSPHGQEGLLANQGQTFARPPSGGLTRAGKLGHDQEAVRPQERGRTLGGDGGAPEGSCPHDVEPAPELRTGAAGLFGPGSDDLDPVSPAQLANRLGQERGAPSAASRSTAGVAGQCWARTRPGRPPPDPRSSQRAGVGSPGLACPQATAKPRAWSTCSSRAMGPSRSRDRARSRTSRRAVGPSRPVMTGPRLDRAPGPGIGSDPRSGLWGCLSRFRRQRRGQARSRCSGGAPRPRNGSTIPRSR